MLTRTPAKPVHFLRAAHEVLERERRAMTANEIVVEAKRAGLLSTKGRTPWKTMNARLSTDILECRDRSKFMRTDAGLFALRAWADRLHEYVAPRRTFALIEEDVLVFDKKHLRQFVQNDGLTSANVDHKGLVALCYAMPRQQAEENYSVIQLVSVYAVREKNRYLTYKRTKRLPEKRLHSVYSAFFGGHLNPDDILPLFQISSSEQVRYFADRELNEEVRLRTPPAAMRFRGLLYDPRTQVSTQHLGVVFVVTLRDRNLEIGERGFLTDLRYETKSEIRRRIADFENWSELLMRERL